MSRRFEELDWQPTPMGEISLRRRLEPELQVDVYEVRLGDEFLMSSLFHVAEDELAHLALAAAAGDELDVVVGGLGLGFTALAALADARVRSCVVVDALEEVLGWHRRRLLPFAVDLVDDPRCRLAAGDFFALARGGFAPLLTDRVHAVLLDVDHSPRHVLHPSHADLYTVPGLSSLARNLHPGGVFGLWSDDPPDEAFLGVLGEVFAAAGAHVVPFANHHTGGISTNTVYVATTEGAPAGRRT